METKIEKELFEIDKSIEIINNQLTHLDNEMREILNENKIIGKDGKFNRFVGFTELQNHSRELQKLKYTYIVLKLQAKKQLPEK